ncbi:MAG: hypothetical protein K6U11_08515 [bacterium]|nr:hypothetical protein [bacterium]
MASRAGKVRTAKHSKIKAGRPAVEQGKGRAASTIEAGRPSRARQRQGGQQSR